MDTSRAAVPLVVGGGGVSTVGGVEFLESWRAMLAPLPGSVPALAGFDPIDPCDPIESEVGAVGVDGAVGSVADAVVAVSELAAVDAGTLDPVGLIAARFVSRATSTPRRS